LTPRPSLASLPALLEQVEQVTFKKGQSGNPAGRRASVAARLTAELRSIVAADAKVIVKSIVESAKAGDVENRRAFLKLLPQAKWPTPFELPKIDGPSDIPGAVKAALGAAAKGDLSIEDSEKIIGMLSGLRQAYEGADLVAKLNEMQARLDEMVAQSGGQG
jgi:hypothetical protein